MRKKILLGLLALVALYLLVLWSDWLPRTSAEQQAALDLLQQPPQQAKGQRDAFPLLWSLRYEMPDAERAKLLAIDQKAYAQMEAAGKAMDFRSRAEGKYTGEWPDIAKLCPRAQTGDCLAHVRANLEQSRSVVTQHAGLLTRAAGLRETDHARYGFRPSLASPLPQLGVGPLQVTAAALDFVEGRPDAALDQSCRDLATWRRLRSHTDMLLLDMVGVAYVSDRAALLAAMLAELPADRPLPDSCTAALATVEADEFDQCDVWRGEFASMANTITGFSASDIAMATGRAPSLQERLTPLMVNERATVASFAPYYASLCGQQEKVEPPKPGVMGRVFNPVGSVYLEIGLADYGAYRQRVRDMAAIVQGLRTVVWLRGQADPADAFAQRPEDLKTTGTETMLDMGQRRLIVPLQQPQVGKSKEWRLPLAASRLPTAVAGAAAPAK